MIEYRRTNGHVEVFHDGVFVMSADTIAEAYQEMRENASPDQIGDCQAITL